MVTEHSSTADIGLSAPYKEVSSLNPQETFYVHVENAPYISPQHDENYD